jgi:3-oxoacyl-[acyl-carrier-protein] synthase-3
MVFNNVYLESFSYHLPEKKLTTQKIEGQLLEVYHRLKMHPGRLEMMTGILERGYWDIGTSPASLATKAAVKIINNPGKVDFLIFASVCRDFLEPACASLVHGNLQLGKTCPFFDLSNACLGVVDAMVMAANLIENKIYKKVLIVSGENSGPLLFSTLKKLGEDESLSRRDVKKLFANLTIGSAAVALLLSDDSQNGHKMLGSCSLVDSSASALCKGYGDTSSLLMETDTEELMEKGIQLAKLNWENAKNLIEPADWVITHQVGKTHEERLFDSLDLKINTFRTYPLWGNTGSAALPLTLMKLSESGLLKKGHRVGLLGMASGLASTMMGIQW